MNTDKELLASEKQAITAAAVSTDSILMTGNLGADRSRNLRAFAQIETAFVAGTGMTGATFEIIQADNAALTTNVESLYSSGAVANAGLTAGNRVIDTPLPRVSRPYLGFRYTTNGGNATAGTVTSGLVIGTDTAFADRPIAETHGF